MIKLTFEEVCKDRSINLQDLDNRQIDELQLAYDDDCDFMEYAKPEFTSRQMHELHLMQKNNISTEGWVDYNISADEMRKYRLEELDKREEEPTVKQEEELAPIEEVEEAEAEVVEVNNDSKAITKKSDINVKYLIKEFDDRNLIEDFTPIELEYSLISKAGEVETSNMMLTQTFLPAVDRFGFPDGIVAACVEEDGREVCITIRELIDRMKNITTPIPVGDTYIRLKRDAFSNSERTMRLYIENENKCPFRYLLDMTSDQYMIKCFSEGEIPYVVNNNQIGTTRVIGVLKRPQFRLNYEFAREPFLFDLKKLYYHKKASEVSGILDEFGPSAFMYMCQFGFNLEAVLQCIEPKVSVKYTKKYIRDFKSLEK